MTTTTLTFEHPDIITARRVPVSAAVPVTVESKDAWEDSWSEEPSWRVEWVEFGSSVTLSKAQLTRRYGRKFDGARFSTVQRQELANKWIRITIGNANLVGDTGAPAQWSRWVGYVDVSANQMYGNVDNVPNGRVTILAFGVDAMLLKAVVTDSLVYNKDVNASRTVSFGIPFNSSVDDRQRVPNRSLTKISGSYQFYESAQIDSEYVSDWRPSDAIEYLLNTHVSHIPIAVDVDDLHSMTLPALPTHGVSVHDLITSIIPRTRGFMWWIEYRSTEYGDWDADDWDTTDWAAAEEGFVLKVASMSDADITNYDGTQTLVPGNTSQLALNVGADAGAGFRIQRNIVNQYDEVVVEGARERYITTLDYADGFGLLQRAWSTQLETYYSSGAAEQNDYPLATEISARREFIRAFRDRPQFNAVFREFKYNTNGGVPKASVDGYQDYKQAVTFLPTMGLLEGVDYSDNAIAAGILLDENGATVDPLLTPERQPLALIRHPNSGYYIRIEDLNRAQEVATSKSVALDWSGSVRVVGSGQRIAINVVGAPQEAIATADFQSLPEEIAQSGINWKTNLLVTIAIEAGRRARGRWPVADPDALLGRPKRTLFVHAGDTFMFDYVVPDTVVDVDSSNGQLITSNGGVLRSDIPRLTDIAKQLYEWHCTERATLEASVSLDDNAEYIRLGSMVSTVKHGVSSGIQTTHTLNTPITHMRIDCAVFESEQPPMELLPPKLHFRTDFAEIDALRLMAADMTRVPNEQ